ncbi:hypothetical protein [Aequorivita viscosa]|uniref:Cytochrome C n=1 Tax=Aequorivita viscosa TaxID=797419 RepID=A0A1M6A853_9FLAO|nr:hypothetical protein [Aequorivita viscosa]SDW12796.1 hypothetical protein SAMN05216556_102107 [Aequorivita viscosa]SHI32652.1 hypothetical protein SAMN04487908_101106 [Aequorivita viscosa]
MKKSLLIVLSLGLFACNQHTDNTEMLLDHIENLESKLEEAYKPGFGDFMGVMQTHHAKLWFAGQNQNWDLADFEIHELEETVENIQKYQSHRQESEMIAMLNAPLDNIDNAIEEKNHEAFKKNFIELTNTCNKCHIAVGFEFNVVKIPDTSPFSNQDFRPINSDDNFYLENHKHLKSEVGEEDK